MPTIELLKNAGYYPSIIYLGGLCATFFLVIAVVYHIFACFITWLRRKKKRGRAH